MRIHVPRTVALFIAWAAFTCGALVIGLGEVLPARFVSVAPEHAFLGLIECELFFVLVIWPFFIPRLFTAAEGESKIRFGEPHLLMVQIGVLLLVGLPVALVTQNVSGAEISKFFVGQLMVGALAAFVAALFSFLGADRVRPWYFAGFFLLSAFVPFVQFLLVEYGGGPGVPFLAAISPFWGAAQLAPGASASWAPAVQSGIFGLLAVSLLTAFPFRKTMTA